MKTLSELAIELREMQHGTAKDLTSKISDALLEIERRLSQMELSSKKVDQLSQSA